MKIKLKRNTDTVSIEPTKTKLKYSTQKQIFGFLFILPWVIGLIIFFAIPFVQTIWYSFNEVKPTTSGLEISFINFANYKYAFGELIILGQNFTQVLWAATKDLFINLPIILIFSLFIAVMLNTKFKGRGIVRAIFFIPVILNKTAIDIALSGQFNNYLQTNGEGGTSFFQSLNFENFLMEMGIGMELIGFLISSVERIFSIVNVSGIPILIFLAALQSIPGHLYEAADVEGATPYEKFWKITFPLVSPMFLVVIVYSVVDSFISSPVISFIDNTRDDMLRYGLSSSIAVIYFLVNILMLLIIYGIYVLLSKIGVFYNEKER